LEPGHIIFLVVVINIWKAIPWSDS
jgi:hypothetical protein